MSRFDTTRWSVVLNARGDAPHAREALETLCRSYRPAVLAYVRGRGYPTEVAEDLVQAFFLRFIEKDWHAGADPERGRFRAYLLTMLKRHLTACANQSHRLKRGGGVQFESIESELDSGANEETPERSFERVWAITVLGRALSRLRAEADAAGRRALFDALREFLVESPDEADYMRAAAKLGLRRNTLAVAVHRLRHRLRDLVHEELAETTSAQSEFDAELHDLGHALACDQGPYL